MLDRENAILQDQVTIESDFYRSLANLATLYAWPLDELLSDKPYPLNIAMSLGLASKRLRELEPETTLVIVNSESHPAALTTVREYDLDNSLHYVSVRPYWRLIQQESSSPLLPLLDSIFAYLNHLRMPYFTNQFGGYVAYQYDFLRDRIEEMVDGEEDEETLNFYHSLTNQVLQMDKDAEVCYSRFTAPEHLNAFADRVASFQVTDPTQKTLLDIASRFLSLYQRFPDYSLNEADIATSEDDDDGLSHWGVSQLVSFIWTDDGEDEVFNEVCTSLDADFNDGVWPENPKTAQFFDTPQVAITHSVDFFKSFFNCLCDLINYLVSIDEKYKQAV